jgi:hypothetical protein
VLIHQLGSQVPPCRTAFRSYAGNGWKAAIDGFASPLQADHVTEVSASNEPTAPAALTVQLPDIPEGWQPLVHAILSDGALAALVTDVDIAGEHERIHAALQDSRAPDPPSRLTELSAAGKARVLIASSSGWLEGPTWPLETPFPLLERFADGRWLVVACRSRGEGNARILSPQGVILDRFNLGDGIEHVAVDTADKIWVGWFDEGMFGNRDWQVPGREWPPSSNGIACFDSNGSILLVPEWPADAGAIADCYALSVSKTGTWVCPYVEFPLVLFSSGQRTRWWRNSLSGLRAIATAGDHAVVAGGYREHANRLALLELDRDGQGADAVQLASWSLPLRGLGTTANERSPVWDRPALLTGRGDTLHLVEDGRWYRWRVADLRDTR